jgi:hypothetical protein
MDYGKKCEFEETDEIRVDTLQSYTESSFPENYFGENKSHKYNLQRQTDDFLNIKCAMNYYCLVEDTANIQIFKCNTCLDKPTNICKWCYKNCHSHDQESKVSLSFVQADKLRCGCAMNNHIIQDTPLQSTFLRQSTKNRDKICRLNEFFFKLNSVVYYVFIRNFEDNNKDEVICLYCVEKCFKKHHHDVLLENVFSKKPRLMFSEENLPVCACKLSYCHSSSNEVIIREIIEDENYEVYFNRQQIPGVVVNSQYFELAKQALTQFHAKISESTDFSKLQSEPLNPHLEASFLLIDSLGLCFKNDYYNFSKNNDLIKSIFSLDFLKLLFKIPPTKNCNLFMVKLHFLNYFRKYILQARPLFIFSKETGSQENISPIHGLIYKQGISEFLESIDINTEKFFDVLGLIFKQAQEYNGKFEDEKFYINFIVQLFKLVNFVFGFKFIKYDKYICLISKDILDLLSVIKEKKKIEPILRKHLEKVVLNFIHTFNEVKLFKSLEYYNNLNEKKQVDLNDEFFAFIEDEKYNLFNILFAFNQTAVDELNFDPSDPTILNNIHESLLASKDYFSEGLKSILESGSDYLNEDNIKLLITITLEENNENIIYLFDNFLKIQLEQNMDHFNIFKHEYYSSEIRSIIYLEIIKGYLENLNDILNNSLKTNQTENEESLKQETNKIRCRQIYFFKYGYYSVLMNIMNIISQRFFLKMHNSQVQEVIKKIIFIFRSITKGNAFNSCLFLNKFAVDFLLDINLITSDTLILEFYLDTLLNFKKENYKVNCTYLISKICIFLEQFINIKEQSYIKLAFDILNVSIEIVSQKTYEFSSSILASFLLNKYQNINFMFTLENFFHSNDDYIKLVIKESLRLTNKVSNFYYYSMTNHIPIKLIERVIYRFDLIDAETLLIFFKTAIKYIAQTPFRIYSDFSKETFENILNRVDANLIGRINQNHEDQENKKKLFHKGEFDEDLMGMRSFLFILKKYKAIFLLYKKNRFFSKFENQEQKIEFYFKFYLGLCVIPMVYSLYKVVYFSELLNFDLKYLIYVLSITFLQTLKFFINELINELTSGYFSTYISLEVKSIIKNRLNLNNIEYNLMPSLISLENSVKDDIEIINSPSFNQLDYQKVIIIFLKNISIFKDIKKIKEYDISNLFICKNILEIKLTNKFIKNIEKVYDNYITTKCDFFNKYITKCFLSTSDQDKYIKKNIAIEFLSYYKQNPGAGEREYYFADICTFTKDNGLYLDIIVKLFKINPEYFQNIMIENDKMRKKIYHIIRKQLVFLYQVVVVDFISLDNNKNLNAYDNLVNLIEFVRLLCENHNQMNQTFLFNLELHNDLNGYSTSFLQFCLHSCMHIIKLIQHNDKKKAFIKNMITDNEISFIYFNNLITSLHNLLIELIQGTLTSNFKKLGEDPCYENYVKLTRNLLYAKNKNEYVFYLGKSFSFLNAVTEDSNNPDNLVVKYFDAKKCSKQLITYFKLLVYVSKHFYSNKISSEEEVNIKSIKREEDNSFGYCLYNFSSKEESLENYKVEEGDHQFINELFVTKSLDLHPYYILSFQLFYLFRNVEIYPEMSRDGLFQNIFKNFKHISLGRQNNSTEDQEESNFELLNSTNKTSNNVLIKETFLFFDQLVKTVEIMSVNKTEITEQGLNKYKNIFPNDNLMNDVFSKAKKEILKSSSNESKLLKVIFINKPEFRFLLEKDVIQFMDMVFNQDENLRKFLISKYVENTLYSLIYVRKNLFLKKSTILNYLYNIDYNLPIKVSLFLSLVINILLVFFMRYDNVDNPGITSYDVNYISIKSHVSNLNLLHMIYLGSIIANFVGFSAYEEYSRDFYIGKFMLKIFKSKIFPLIFNFICGCLANISTPFSFFYALQLFSIMSIFPIMKAAISSIFLRYVQFLSTALLLVIVCIFYGSICIFFLNSGMTDGDSGKSTCESFWQCVLHILNGGIRSGSLGFPIKSISATGYWQEFIVDWTFYLIVILTLLNFVNGIIVDTFNELYEEDLTKVENLKDICFICDQKRLKFEVRGVDFENHKFIDHYILNYFYYIINIQKQNKYDLNGIDSQVLEAIKANRTDFLPFKKSWDMNKFLDDDEDEKDVHEKKENDSNKDKKNADETPFNRSFTNHIPQEKMIQEKPIEENNDEHSSSIGINQQGQQIDVGVEEIVLTNPLDGFYDENLEEPKTQNSELMKDLF